jgi:hypothetical protein
MRPYYEQDGIVIYHGDCAELLPQISPTVLITDPPYGVELGSSDSRGGRHGLAKSQYASYEDTFDNFMMIVVPAINDALSRVIRGAVFAGKHITRYAPPDALGGIYCPSAIGRGRWGFTQFFPVLLYGYCPTLHLGARHTVLYSTEVSEQNGHPCPKPIGWMHWLVNLVSQPNDVLVDPFMGSGTTLVAAKRFGRKAIGIELEEKYCEIAAKRLAQGALDLFGEASA